NGSHDLVLVELLPEARTDHLLVVSLVEHVAGTWKRVIHEAEESIGLLGGHPMPEDLFETYGIDLARVGAAQQLARYQLTRRPGELGHPHLAQSGERRAGRAGTVLGVLLLERLGQPLRPEHREEVQVVLAAHERSRKGVEQALGQRRAGASICHDKDIVEFPRAHGPVASDLAAALTAFPDEPPGARLAGRGA